MGWEQFFGSALVAAAVTLLLEYAAKPRLEARKEKILERYQELRTLRKDLVRIMYDIHALEGHMAFWYTNRERISDNARALYNRLETFRSNWVLAALEVPASIRTLVSSATGELTAHAHSIEEAVKQGDREEVDSRLASMEQPYERLGLAVESLWTERLRHFPSRLYARHRAKQLVQDTQEQA